MVGNDTMMTCRLFVCLAGLVLLAPSIVFAQQGQGLPPAYQAGRGHLMTGDFAAAIDDFSKAIEAAPDRPEPYIARGLAKIHLFDATGAIADFNQAIALDKHISTAYFGRGIAEQMNGGFDAAMDDYEHLIKRYPANTDAPHFYLWLVRVQLNQKDDADKELTDYLTTRPSSGPNDWNVKVGGFLLGHVSEANLLTAAETSPTLPDKGKAVCVAYYFVGMKRLIAGDKIDAADNFRKALATNETMLTEYPLAHAEFQALQHQP
jgi:lipoprotein NlpI